MIGGVSGCGDNNGDIDGCVGVSVIGDEDVMIVVSAGLIGDVIGL